MADIKLISEDTDMSKVKMYELDWDVSVNGKQYKVYRVPGFIHTLGGRWGENDYWACPRNENPTVENLWEFDGEPVRYGVYITENHYFSNKWDESSIEASVKCIILRNDEEFYHVGANSISYAYAKAYSLITEIKEGVINFSSYDFPHKEIIGRHIWWKGKPYTLCTYMKGQCCSMAVPGHIEIKSESDYYDNYDKYDGESVKLDLLADKHIGWFCKDY